MITHKMEPPQWPNDIAHATEEATTVWRCKKKGREFWIFRQPNYQYLVREQGDFGWLIVDGKFETLGAAKKAVEAS